MATDERILLREVERLFDDRAYTEVRDALRASALSSSPSDDILQYLALAEFAELLQFRGSLIQKYPDSLSVLIDEAHRLLDAHHPGPAFSRCNILLSGHIRSTQDELMIKNFRLKAAVACGKPDFFVGDFLAIWSFFSSNDHYSREMLRHCVLTITSITKPTFMESLSQIRRELAERDDMLADLKENIHRIIDYKYNQLEVILAWESQDRKAGRAAGTQSDSTFE